MFSPIYSTVNFTTAGQVDIPIVPPFIPARGNAFGPVDVRDIIAMQESVNDEEYARLRRRVIEQMRQPIERANQAETGTVNEYQCCVCDLPSSGPVCDDYTCGANAFKVDVDATAPENN